MNKIIKWMMVFSILAVWTAFLTVDKAEMLKTPFFPSVQAMESESPPNTYYDYNTSKILSEGDVIKIIRWYDYKVFVMVDINNMTNNLHMMGIETGEKRILPRSSFELRQLVNNNPGLVEAYPGLEVYKRNFGGGKAGAFQGMTLS